MAIVGQHDFDGDMHPALGPPIRPAPVPPAPRRFNSDGTIWQAPDGKLSTSIPTPPDPKAP